MRVRMLLSLFAIASLLPLLGGCETAPKTETGRENLRDETDTALRSFEREDPDLKDFLNNAAGYVVFPSIGKAGFGVGAAYGRGVVYEGDKQTGFASLSQGSLGLQAGAQDTSELVVFGTREALNKFKDGKFEFGANASAIILKEGAAKSASFRDGVAVFTKAKSGAMVELSLSGQKLKYLPNEEELEREERTETRTQTETKTEERKNTY